MEFYQNRSELINKYMRTANRNANKELNKELKDLCSELPFPETSPFFEYCTLKPTHLRDQNRKAREGLLSENTRLHALNAELQDSLEEQKLYYEKELRNKHKQMSDLKKQAYRIEENCCSELEQMQQKLEFEKEKFASGLKEARNALGLSYASQRNHSDAFFGLKESFYATFEKLKARIKDLDKEAKRLKAENKDLHVVAFGLLDDIELSDLKLGKMRKEFEQLFMQCRYAQKNKKPLVYLILAAKCLI